VYSTRTGKVDDDVFVNTPTLGELIPIALKDCVASGVADHVMAVSTPAGIA
jgi:hypothetical protein